MDSNIMESRPPPLLFEAPTAPFGRHPIVFIFSASFVLHFNINPPTGSCSNLVGSQYKESSIYTLLSLAGLLAPWSYPQGLLDLSFSITVKPAPHEKCCRVLLLAS